jgi:hypothetical protein
MGRQNSSSFVQDFVSFVLCNYSTLFGNSNTLEPNTLFRTIKSTARYSSSTRQQRVCNGLRTMAFSKYEKCGDKVTATIQSSIYHHTAKIRISTHHWEHRNKPTCLKLSKFTLDRQLTLASASKYRKCY